MVLKGGRGRGSGVERRGRGSGVEEWGEGTTGREGKARTEITTRGGTGIPLEKTVFFGWDCSVS